MGRDAEYKGTAFKAPLAATLRVGVDFKLVWSNAALNTLLRACERDFAKALVDLDPGSVVGCDFHGLQAPKDLRAAMSGTEPRPPMSQTFKLDKVVVTLLVSPVASSKGEHIGFVTERSDQTDLRRNTAIVTSLSETQAQFDVTLDGKLSAMNSVAAELIGDAKMSQIIGRAITDVLSLEQDSSDAPSEF